MSGMKTATIKKLLKNRIDDWLSSVKDQTLVEMIKKDVIVSGGAIASALLGEKINDYDFYFRTKATALAVAQYYVSVFNSTIRENLTIKVVPEVKLETRKNCKGVDEERIIIYMKSSGVASETQSDYRYYESQPEAAQDEFFSDLAMVKDDQFASAIGEPDDLIKAGEDLVSVARNKEKYRPIFLSENAITLSDKVQLVVRFFGEARELHENYDFAHAMCWFDYDKYDLVAPHEALESMLSKTLIYKGSLYPIASLFRTRKFLARGWRISAGQMLKIIFQVSKLNLEDRAVLREQLIGVDQAYMTQLLSAIEANKSNRIDSVYIANLIDEIFE